MWFLVLVMLTAQGSYNVIEIGQFADEKSCQVASLVVSSEKSNTSNVFVCLEEPKNEEQ